MGQGPARLLLDTVSALFGAETPPSPPPPPSSSGGFTLKNNAHSEMCRVKVNLLGLIAFPRFSRQNVPRYLKLSSHIGTLTTLEA